MSQPLLPRRSVEEFRARNRGGVPPEILEEAAVIVEAVRSGGEEALREYATRFEDCAPDAPLYLTRETLQGRLDELPEDERNRLERICERIRAFAQSQLGALAPLDTPVPGGRAGHRIDPVEAAGCYAPGGRYPLPSSVLMTVVTARAAGVRSVWVASPRPAPITLAAAAVAGADGVLVAGGAHAIAALAVEVHDPRAPIEALYGGLCDRLPYGSLVQLRIAHMGEEASGSRLQPVAVKIIANERPERDGARGQSDRPGREVRLVGVLGAARVRLQPAELPEGGHVFHVQVPEQVLDGVVHGGGVRLDRHPVVSGQGFKVERAQDGH